MISTADFRYLRPDSPLGQTQIRTGLSDLGVSNEVIDWIFETFDQQRQEYTTLQRELRETKAQLPEE
jgi:SOS response regulatory protein OraA/RecX